jgi:hypothetical protein
MYALNLWPAFVRYCDDGRLFCEGNERYARALSILAMSSAK